MKKILFLLLLLSLYLQANTINLALAANVSYAIDALKAEFHKTHPKTQLNVILGSSGKLTAQIKNGAPYDIFMSANMLYPDTLFQEGFTVHKARVYAKGSLVLFSTKKQDFSQGLKLVTSPNIRRIAIANPKTAPYGIATKEALENAELYKKIKAKFVYGESVAQTVAYSINASDMGFIAKSALYSPKMKKYTQGKNFIDLDTKLYTPIKQGIILLKRAAHNPEAQAFYTFMLSKKAKKILNDYGYITQ